MITSVTTQPELDDDARWAKWKRDGAERDSRRKERMRQVIAALFLFGGVWLVLQF